DFEVPPQLFEGVPRGGMALVCGKSNAGKSMFARYLSGCLAGNVGLDYWGDGMAYADDSKGTLAPFRYVPVADDVTGHRVGIIDSETLAAFVKKHRDNMSKDDRFRLASNALRDGFLPFDLEAWRRASGGMRFNLLDKWCREWLKDQIVRAGLDA